MDTDALSLHTERPEIDTSGRGLGSLEHLITRMACPRRGQAKRLGRVDKLGEGSGKGRT